ncbi:hypothetical protein [Maribacter sp.]
MHQLLLCVFVAFIYF